MLPEKDIKEPIKVLDTVQSGTSSKKALYVLIGVVLIILVALLSWVAWFFFKNYEPPVNHLISGVPYYGVYNLYPASFTTSAISVLTMLRYYNDERQSDVDIWKIFPDERRREDDLANPQTARSFFQTQGYNTFSLKFNEENRDKKTDEIKQFIKNDIPVIVIEESSLLSADGQPSRHWKVVIGMFDDQQEAMVHDATFGNNYTIPYAELEESILEIITAWPKEHLAQELPAPGNGLPYPQRASIMDTFNEISLLARGGHRASLSAEKYCDYLNEKPGDPTSEEVTNYIALIKESVKLREAVINHPMFSETPRLFQFRNKMWRANALMESGEVSKAREIILNELIPENHDLDTSIPGFEPIDTKPFLEGQKSALIIDGKMPHIWKMLMLTYRYEGRYAEAVEAFLPYFDILPEDESALEQLAKLRNPELQVRPERTLRCMGGKDVIK